jgi:wyosine [tRNA(Phe)-imidazoG37] synthetase (radical SAM superfamily)
MYCYGPVPSRRLGRSLGVDLVPMKTCSLDCVYCQLQATESTTVLRRDYAPVDDVLAELKQKLKTGPRPDYITLGGGGEPTLHSSFGDVAAGARVFSDVPVALLTNGSLMHLPEVRAACGDIALIVPSLDAGDEPTYRRVNRPHSDLTLEQLVDGLAALRREFSGQIWLEVFMVDGMNTSDDQVRAIARQAERIAPDRIQVNTAVRPPAEASVRVPSPARLARVCELLGPRAELVAGRPLFDDVEAASARQDEVLAMLRRRPCTADDIAAGLGVAVPEVLKHTQALLADHRIRVRQRLYETYFEEA